MSGLKETFFNYNFNAFFLSQISDNDSLKMVNVIHKRYVSLEIGTSRVEKQIEDFVKSVPVG